MSGAGWNLKEGEINSSIEFEHAITNFFSKKNRMNNLYKLLLFQAILNIENRVNKDVFYEVAIEFAELYFECKKNYELNMTIYNGRSKKSAVDILIQNLFKKNIQNYKTISEQDKIDYIYSIKEVLKTNVVGALYKSLNEVPYSFNIKLEKLELNNDFKNFLDSNKGILENLIFYRMVEFFKISEKDEKILEKEMEKNNILNYKEDFYLEIQEEIKMLLK
ncbi:hypothetical protein ACQ9ZF_03615 [Cetobacterium somerae]|uniref:hypothetical protein n=1 Tax=Cetobacterium somerae TaxID=188913 RepID=UPI003D768D4E